MTKDKKKVYAMYLGMRSIVSEQGITAGHAEIGVVEIRENGDIRNPETGHVFDDLTFYCQWSEKFGPDPFAFEVYVDAHRADLQRLVPAVKILRKARRVEKSFQVRPLSFGQWAVMMARGLGITKLAKHVGGTGMSFADNEHRTFSLSEAQGVIDAAIADTRKVAEVAA
jgi:hypothetical protein